MIAIGALLLAQTLYTDHGNPTNAEQRVLEIINRARADPAAEGVRLAIPGGITEGMSGPNALDVGVRPPLAMNLRLLTAARAHGLDMYTRAFFAHVNPDGADPGDRITAAGYVWSQYGENIAMSSADTAEALEDLLMVDAGVAGRGHRLNLLDVDSTSTIYSREVGIGYYSGPVAKPIAGAVGNFRDFIVQDFGRSATGPFLLGVVYLDANNNLFYDEGEGLGGVAATPSSGAFRAVTASAGGYAFPTAAAGPVNLTFSSTSIPADVIVGLTLTADNRKIDLRVPPQADGDADGLPDFWEARFPTASAAGADTDGDTYTNLQEFKGGSDPTNAASTPVAPAAPPPPPPPPPGGGGSSSGGGGGGCGATGLEALAVAFLAGLSRRGRRRV